MEFERENLKESRQGNNQYTKKTGESGSSSRDPEATGIPKEPQQESAEDAGVSPKTYARAKYIHKHGDEKTKQALRDGDLKINRAYLDLKGEEKKEEAEDIVL